MRFANLSPFFLSLCVYVLAAPARDDQTWKLNSFSGLDAVLTLSNGALSLSLANGDTQIVTATALGVRTSQSDFSSGLAFGDLSTQKLTGSYEMLSGKSLSRNYDFEESAFTFKNSKDQVFGLRIRLSQNGVAFAYELPDIGDNAVGQETTQWNFSKDGSAYLMTSYTAWYEEEWAKFTISNGSGKSPVGFPALFQPDSAPDTYVLLTEANVNGKYSASQLTHGDNSLSFGFTLFEGTKISYSGSLTTPWRVAIIGNLGSIVSSTLVDDLSDARFDGDFSWVRPGVSSWSWLTDGSSPSNEARQYDFVALAARNKWEYVLLDEGWDASWVPRVASNASAQNVGTLIWFHHDDLNDASQMGTTLDQVKSWGVAGVKIDFMNSDSQPTFQWYDDISRATYDRQIMVYYHGATIPHGLQRKWPHIMTYEAVRGAENGINTVRTMIIPYTRNVVGSMDWTPGAFSRDNSQASYALQAGFCIIFESGIQHISDKPENYAAQPALNNFLVDLPTVWDETVLINGTPASNVVIGRRSGDRWFFGGGAVGQQSLSLPLKVLGDGKWLVTLVKDGSEDGNIVSDAIDSSTQVLSSDDTITVQTASNGGFAAVACPYNGQESC